MGAGPLNNLIYGQGVGRSFGYLAPGTTGYALLSNGAALPSYQGFTQVGAGAIVRTWQDKARDLVNGADFGALGDGAANNAEELNAACASGAKIVILGPGTFNAGAAITVPNNVTLIGAGSGATAIVGTFATGDFITLGVNSHIEGIKIAHSVTRTSGVSLVLGGNLASADHLEMEGYFQGIKMHGASGAALIVGAAINDVVMRSPATGANSYAASIHNFSNAIVRDLIASGSGGTQPDAGLIMGHGDTAFLDAVNITLHGKPFLCAPTTSESCFSVTGINCKFDSPSGALDSSAHLTPSNGFIYNMVWTGTWFGFSTSQNGCTIGVSGSGGVDGITFIGCEFPDNAGSGLSVSGSAVKNINVVGGNAAGNGAAGYDFSNATTYFSVVGVISGNVSARGVNGYGIRVQAGASNNYVITDNICIGNSSDDISDSGTGTNKRIRNNITGNAVDNTGPLPAITVYTSGSGTFTTPAGATHLFVEGVGGGGGGAGSGTTPGAGGNGGDTTFGTLTGGGGTGAVLTNVTANAGGVGTNGDDNIPGGTGGGVNTSLATSFGGTGGGTAFGSSTPVLAGGFQLAGIAGATNTGAGGSGASNGATGPAGGGGGGGGGFKKLITSPSATYSYGVGAGGTAGTAGTSGAAGGAGAAGKIIVMAYFQ